MTKEELKQEAEEWLCNNLHSANEEDFINAMVDIAEPREKRIADLEKENAELKKQLEMSNKVYNDNLDYSHHIEEQLTKAKELIENLLYYVKQCTCERSNYAEIEEDIKEAEQFLKENSTYERIQKAKYNYAD